MKFAYDRLEHCILLDNLKNEVISKTLAYMVDFKEHENLVVIQKTHSIEISNADICIAVIVFSGFEKEYEILKTKKNHHVISFDTTLQLFFEFDYMPIKYLDYMALFFMSLARTEDANIKEFLHLRNPSANETICRLKKEYFLKGVVWNYDLFSLLYKKNTVNSSCQKTKNQFTTSMILDSYPAAFYEYNLKNINSSFVKEFVKNRNLLAMKEIQSELGNSEQLLVGFAVVSGRNRAKKAIRLALSTPLLNNTIIEKTKTILLHISSDVIEMNLDETGVINDIIQERVGNKADIIMTVSEDKNLGKSLSITIIMSEFDSSENKS
ncbi:hypothetical protein [Flavobacterium sp. GNP002]